jgi:hypothetical protein
MLFKLFPMVQDHGEQICGRVMRQLHETMDLEQIRRLPESYLRQRLQDVTTRLGRGLGSGRESLVKHYRELGRLCFEQSVPLHETVYLLHLLKDNINDFVREQGFAQSSLELYAEQQLEQYLSRLFGGLLYQVACGYEQALREAAGRMPAVCRLPLPRLSSRASETDEGGQEYPSRI